MATFSAVILKGDIHIREDKKTNIKIRITHNRTTAYISTDLYIIPDNFEKGWALKGKKQEKDFINGRLTDELYNIQQRYLPIAIEYSNRTANELKQALTRKDEVVNIEFYPFAEKIMSELRGQGKATADHWHKPTISQLRKFKPELYVSKIDLRFLKDFQKFLEDSGVGAGINNYMRSFRSLFNKAREFYNDEDRGIIRIPQYPFGRYKIPTPKKKRAIENSLTAEELRMFINYKPKTAVEQYARDISLLMFYLIGINAKDLYYCSKPVNGRINYDRAKTGKEYSIKIEPEAQEIIDRYPGDRLVNANEAYSDHLNLIHYVNIQLRGDDSRDVTGIFKKLGIEKHVTTNWFRYTWATIARNNCEISKDDIALCLGHEDKDNQVTDEYINYDYSIIDKANRKVLDFVKLKIEDVTESKEKKPGSGPDNTI
ncbi:MAG: phage integrase SAM-like domain-containing protein [Mangrovibacterium sp.]